VQNKQDIRDQSGINYCPTTNVTAEKSNPDNIREEISGFM